MTVERYFEYGSWFDKEQKFQNTAEIFLLLTILLSLVDVLEELNFYNNYFEISDLLKQSLVTLVFLLALVSVLLEKMSQRYAGIGDLGRRAYFYLDLFSDGFKTKQENELEKHFVFDRNLFVKSYSNLNLGLLESVEKFKVKIFRMYVILFKLEMSRKFYKRRLEVKYYPIWVILFILIIGGLEIGSPTIGRFIFYFLTILVLSPYTFKTVSVIWNSDKKTEFFRNTRNTLLNLNNSAELHYLFLEYSIELQDIFKVPNKIYNKNRDHIESELKQHLRQKEPEFNRKGIYFTKEFFSEN